MSEYGLRIRNENNTIIYDTTSTTWNQLDTFTLVANSSYYRDYNTYGISEVIVMQTMVYEIPDDQAALAYTINIYGTSIQLSGGNQDVILTVLGR